MSWTRFSDGLRLEPIAKGEPEALVVLLPDDGESASTIARVATRWAAAVPTTAFVALDGSSTEAVLDREARRIAPMIDGQLRADSLGIDQLVMVGFGRGGSLAIDLVLHHDWMSAGVLAFTARLARPLPPVLEVHPKVRLIDTLGDDRSAHGSLRETVSLLTARGLDTRGVALAGSFSSEEAIRHGAAYLGELVATAQRSSRSLVNISQG